MDLGTGFRLIIKTNINTLNVHKNNVHANDEVIFRIFYMTNEIKIFNYEIT